MKPLPCHCDAPNEFCKRAGREMLGKLWEKCRGVNCTFEESENFRRKWDQLPEKKEVRRCIHLSKRKRDENGSIIQRLCYAPG